MSNKIHLSIDIPAKRIAGHKIKCSQITCGYPALALEDISIILVDQVIALFGVAIIKIIHSTLNRKDTYE